MSIITNSGVDHIPGEGFVEPETEMVSYGRIDSLENKVDELAAFQNDYLSPIIGTMSDAILATEGLKMRVASLEARMATLNDLLAQLEEDVLLLVRKDAGQ